MNCNYVPIVNCYESKLDFVFQNFKKYAWIKIKVGFFASFLLFCFVLNCLFLRLVTNHDNMVSQSMTARIVTNNDNRLLQFYRYVITIHDNYYYNSRQALLQFTTVLTKSLRVTWM